MAAVERCGVFIFFIYVITLTAALSGPIVKEMNDELGPWKNSDEAWLIMFHAPWCGHCRQLSPTYHRVGQDLHDSDINVGKLDCTLYGHLAGVYEVRGFPTIKYIHGETNFTHRGERNKEDIVEFTRRAHGPPVRELSSYGKYMEVKSHHSDGVFFMYVGEVDPNEELLAKYTSVAERYRIYSYFYAGPPKVLPQEIKIEKVPSIVVFKDKSHYVYEPESGIETKASLESWISEERFLAFPRVQGANLNEMSDVNKYLVIVTVDGPNSKDRVKDMVEILATKKKDVFHKNFQFVWMSDNDALDSITMSTLPFPSLLVLNTQTQNYYLPPNANMDVMVQPDLEDFLHKIKDERIPAFGGTGVLQRIKRVFYDLLTSVYSVWVQSRLLFFVMFGVPTMIVSVVCYGLCCMDTYEGEGEDGEEETDEGESGETIKVDNDSSEMKELLPKTEEEKKTD